MSQVLALGPHPDEFADFEAACRPRRRPLTLARVLKWLAVVGLVFAAVWIEVWAMHQFDISRTDQRVLGTWRAVDHPTISEITFYESRNLRGMRYLAGTAKDGFAVRASYRYLAQSTMQIFWDKGTEQWLIRFRDTEMTTTDKEGRTFRWLRR
jgi:hypothetical protein